MADWFFPMLNGGEEQGLNDAGIETFKKEDSLARETCQNIGDVWDHNSGEPAVATFELINLPAEEFPGRVQFRKNLLACRDYVLEGLPDGTGNEAKFFENALGVLDRETIPLLRIRDENTSGLVGGDTDRRMPFFRLLKGTGASSLQGDGGGTYGIGQRAPFAHSALRTVFYSTRTADGAAFIAKSILASFPDPSSGEMTQAKGWWCDVSESGTSWSTIRDESRIPARFLREKIGTDLWLAGFLEDSWERSVRHSVLKHFFAAIQANQLTVQLARDGAVETRITSANLDEELIRAAEEARQSLPKSEYAKGLGAALYFNKALSEPYGAKPFTRQIPELGQVKLYVYRDTTNPDMPDRWASMRKPRIIVEHHGSGILNRFAAVLVCDSDQGNRYLAELEGPEHNRWHQEETRQWTSAEKKRAQEVLSELRAFVRDVLKDIRGQSMAEQQDIPFLGRYLPAENDVDSEAPENAISSESNDRSEEESGRLRTKPAGRKPVTGTAHKRAPSSVENLTEVPAPRPGPLPGPLPKPSPDPNPDPRPGPNPVPDFGDGEGEEPLVQTFSPSKVRFRSFRVHGGYRVVLESPEDVSGRLKICAIGETGEFPVQLMSATDDSNSVGLEVEGSSVEGIALVAGLKKTLSISIESETELVLAMGE